MSKATKRVLVEAALLVVTLAPVVIMVCLAVLMAG